MADTVAQFAGQASDSPTAMESQNKAANNAPQEVILQDILNTMHESDIFPRTGKDASSRFWSAYERVAKQHDEELIERHNGEMDVLLIFVWVTFFCIGLNSFQGIIQAGLFSAVSSAFIVNMQSSLSPNASDMTNALLMLLVYKIDNTTFPAQQASLPVWTGPSSMTIWIQTLAYTSLSSSLLAAFGAMLGKQWLGHFKTSRFGRGALHERCQRRQQKLDGLEAWHFTEILASLPVLLQLSLFFFGVALAANVWTLQHTVASVIMATTMFGFIFYVFTVVSSLKSPDCPFQTHVSAMLQYVLRDIARFRMVVRQKWESRPKTWADFLHPLRDSSGRALNIANDLVAQWITPFATYGFRMLSTLRQVPSVVAVSEEAGGSERSGAGIVENSASGAEELDPSFLEPVKKAQAYVQSSAVQWIIETSTDFDNVAAAAGMVLETEWPTAEDVTGVLDRLKSHLYACFDPTGNVLPLARAGAIACLKAICHFEVERDRVNALFILPHGEIYSRDNDNRYYLLPDQAYLVVCYAVPVDEVDPIKLDIKTLPVYDRMWMARMLTYRMHRDGYRPSFVTRAFVIDFITTCFDSKSPGRLVTDCLLLAGMLVGVAIERRHLAMFDRSQIVTKLRTSVFDRTLGVLIGEIPGSHETALKLIHPLLEDVAINPLHLSSDHQMSERAVKFFFLLLQDNTPGEDHIRSRNLALLILIIASGPIGLLWKWCTPAQIDLLMDYHLHTCDGTDYDTIKYTSEVFATVVTRWLRSPMSTPDKTHRYINMVIRLMSHGPMRHAALEAACTIRSTVVLMGRDNESLRESFSRALASAALPDATRTPLANNPFKDISSFVGGWIIDYFSLLCTLCNDPSWQPQLYENGHFDNCLAIANTLLTESDVYLDGCVIYVARILAIIDASGKEHPFFNAIQTYHSWPLILRVWRNIPRFAFAENATKDDRAMVSGDHRRDISGDGYFGSHPSLVAYARKQSDNRKEPLIALVEQLYHKLAEETQQHEHEDDQHSQDSSFGYRGVPALVEQIHGLLDTTWKDA